MITIHRRFDKDALIKIANDAQNKQIKKDVQYAAFLYYHNAKDLYCEWIDGGFIIGQFQKHKFRVIGLCTDVEHRGKGYAKMLLKRAEKAAKQRGLLQMLTLSKSGADFYVKNGYDVLGIKHGDYILSKSL